MQNIAALKISTFSKGTISVLSSQFSVLSTHPASATCGGSNAPGASGTSVGSCGCGVPRAITSDPIRATNSTSEAISNGTPQVVYSALPRSAGLARTGPVTVAAAGGVLAVVLADPGGA